eukprot:852471-Pleurochrysis_carterae.AAC.1
MWRERFEELNRDVLYSNARLSSVRREPDSARLAERLTAAETAAEVAAAAAVQAKWCSKRQAEYKELQGAHE